MPTKRLAFKKGISFDGFFDYVHDRGHHCIHRKYSRIRWWCDFRSHHAFLSTSEQRIFLGDSPKHRRDLSCRHGFYRIIFSIDLYETKTSGYRQWFTVFGREFTWCLARCLLKSIYSIRFV